MRRAPILVGAIVLACLIIEVLYDIKVADEDVEATTTVDPKTSNANGTPTPPSTGPPADSIFLFKLGRTTKRHGLGSVISMTCVFNLYFQQTRNATLALDERNFGNYRRNETHGAFKGFLLTDFPVLDKGDNVTLFLEEWRHSLQQQHYHYNKNASQKEIGLITLSHEGQHGWRRSFSKLLTAKKHLRSTLGSNASVYGRLKTLACGFRYRQETLDQTNAILRGASIPSFEYDANSTVAFHIRRGDKVKRGESNAYSANAYVQRLVNATTEKQRSAIEHCYVATDQHTTIPELRAELKAASISCQVHTMARPQHGTSRDSQQAILLMVDMHVLSRAAFFVGTFNSNVGRISTMWRSCGRETDDTANEENLYRHYY